MKPLSVLIIAFAISLVSIYFINGRHDWQLAGRIAMAAMLVFTAIGHFAFTKGMAMMLPTFIPARDFMVRLTGIIEILGASGLLVSSVSRLTGWLLIVFFVLVLPANIYAALRQVDYQKGTHNGPGISYLWLRIPLQLLFIGWVYWAAIY